MSKAFPGVKALDKVSLDVRPGIVHGIVGENGAGKSTLMKILSGVYEKDSGEIVFEGNAIDKITPVQSMQMGLSIIYQELNLVNTMTVGENIFLGRFSQSGGRAGVHAKARRLLDSIGSKVSTYRQVSELSVSDKQMVEIAKALSFDSKLIIMDEPSSSLTADEMDKLVQIIGDLKAKGIAIIYISHKLDEIFGFCDVVTVMRDGHVMATRPVKDITRNEMISLMVGRTIENEFPPRPEAAGETILEIKSMNTRKLKDIKLTLRKGEILGLVGLVGSGRTELVRALFGADKVAKKSIYLDGKPVADQQPDGCDQARSCDGAGGPEAPGPAARVLRRAEHLAGGAGPPDRVRLHQRQGRGQGQRSTDQGAQCQDAVRKDQDPDAFGRQPAEGDPGRWLEMHPEVLVLDEPTKGIDVGAKYEIYLLMKKIVEDGGAIILISSELPEVLHMSNRVNTICEGRINGEFDPVTASVDEIMAKAFEFA